MKENYNYLCFQHGFLIVPKSPKDTPSSEVKSRYWRLSFQEQERRIIDNKGRLKSALKLIKVSMNCAL